MTTQTNDSSLIEYEVTLGYEGELAKIITLKTHLGPEAAARRARHALFMADRGAHDEMPIVVSTLEIGPARCGCPDDCGCRKPWRQNVCGCKAHA